MSEMVDLMLNGVLCEVCGGLIDGECSGFPRKCEDCEEEE